MPKALNFAELQTEARQFRDQFQSVVLSSISNDATPTASYAPVILDSSETPHIFVSSLAEHTKNLLHSPSVSLLFIADESNSRNLFARQRLTLQCHAKELDQKSDQAQQVLAMFQQSFGKMAALVQSLGDFHLFRLEIISGNYVRGFGQAYDIDDATLKIKSLLGK